MSLIDAIVPLYKLCNAMLTKISLLIPPIKWGDYWVDKKRKKKKDMEADIDSNFAVHLRNLQVHMQHA